MYPLLKWRYNICKANKKVSGFWSLHTWPQTSTSAFLIHFFAMKRCPIAAKIAGSIGIMPCCALNDFFTSGMNVCPICEASLSHHGKFGPVYTMYRVYNVSRISLLAKKLWLKQKKGVATPILKPTDDQKPETSFFGLKLFYTTYLM